MPTKIEWTDETWNPVTGCTPVSEGCENCYAERFALRLAGRAGYPARPYHFKVTLHPDRLEHPTKWRKPRRIFVCSMGDLFHEDVPDEFIHRVYTVMGREAKQHIFIVLTKRSERALAWYKTWAGSTFTGESIPYPNVWLGVTAENQARADERIPVLLSIPAAVRFVSIEPMLGPVDLSGHGSCHCPDAKGLLDWVIVGGETGPGARFTDPDWVRDVRDQCQAAGVPFFFKQWSGKRKSGRLLDGREWNEYP